MSARARPSIRTSRTMYASLHETYRGSSEFQLIPSAQLFFDQLHRDIATAQSSIDLQFYTFEADAATMPLIRALLAAADRGVRIRILADHTTSNPFHLPATIAADLALRSRSTVTLRRRHTTRLSDITKRNHKKSVIIDDRTAYIGGVNLAARSLRWNDFMVRIQGDVVQWCAQEFVATFTHTYFQSEHSPESIILTDCQHHQTIMPYITDRIHTAKDRIWIETPYFNMAHLGQTLIAAKRRCPALDIRVIIPRFNNYPADRLRARHICRTLGAAGIAVGRYGITYRRLNHAKLFVADETAVFGSSNFNVGTLAGGNDELAIATTSRDALRQFQQWFDEDWRESLQ